MTQPSEQIIKRLFALSGNRCAYPGCPLPIVETAGTVTGEICHIHARNPGGPRYDAAQSASQRNGFGNLLLLCRSHHKVIDDQADVYTAEVLREIKSVHEAAAGRPEQKTDGVFAKLLLNNLQRVDVSNNCGNVAINSPGAIQAQTVNLKMLRQRIAVNPPPGTIGANAQQSRYVQYLIKRYNEFASQDRSRGTKFSYAVISGNIERQFGGPWKLLSSDHFDALCEYLHQRISRTILGKLNAAKGHRAFSTYGEFLAKRGEERV